MMNFKKSLILIFALAFGVNTFAQQQRMSPELLWKLKRVSGQTLSLDGKTLIYSLSKYDLHANSGNTDLYSMPVSGGESRQLTSTPGSEYDVQYRPDGKKIGYIHKGQIWEMNLDGSEARQITQIDGGIAHFKYAPSGKHIAYAKEVKVFKTVKDTYSDLPKADAMVYDDLMYRHWDSYEDMMFNHLFVAPYADGSVGDGQDILEGKPYNAPTVPFGGAEDFVWSKDGLTLVYVCKKKFGKEYALSTNTDLYAYNITNGETKNLTEGMKGYDTHPTFSSDGKYLAWLSMRRDGYESDKNDIVLVNWNNPAQKVNLSAGWDETVESFVFSNDNKLIYFKATVEATSQLFELKISMKPADVSSSKHIRQITKGDHNVGGIIGQSGKELISSKMDMNRASELFAFDAKTGSPRAMSDVNGDIYSNLETGKIEKRWVNTHDGKKMLVWVILPPNFDPDKKYPTLLYCQGGPQSAVSQFYSFRWNFQLMAANDYVIIAPNRRGLPGFGTEWNEAISGDWGGAPMKDYLAAFDEVAKESWVDKDRTAAIGASYGGYSVYMLAGIHENRFKSFISHCGLFNLESWYGSTEELFFANFDIGGPYWANPTPESYKKFSPHKYADKWNTPIMVIHGGKDYRVPDTQGMEAYQLAQLKGLKSRFLYFPNEGHWVLQPQNGVLWHREFFRWLKETVKDIN